jgi:hypothetical protein
MAIRAARMVRTVLGWLSIQRAMVNGKDSADWGIVGEVGVMNGSNLTAPPLCGQCRCGVHGWT